jgi:Ribonuclease G/E
LPEWLIEHGIGETRAALVDNGEIVESRVELTGAIAAGNILPARLANIGANGRNVVAVAEGGIEFLIPRGAAGRTQGATLNIEITREAIPGSEPWKRPLAWITEQNPEALPPLEHRLGARRVVFPSPTDEFNQVGWSDLIDQARTGHVAFAGGELRISPTPAMTLIDVDGYLAPDDLAVLGSSEAARAIRRLDIGGSIGIDLPTVRSKAARQAAAAAIDEELAPPFERTAVNGFGFMQIVRPRTRASLLELAQDRASFEARALLRRAAMQSPGPQRLVVHPAVAEALARHPDWIASLTRQIGGAVELRPDATIPIFAGYAESL